MAAVDAQWPNDYYLADHFRAHRLDTGTVDEDEYDQSARWVVLNGQRFTFWNDEAGETRVGYYDEGTRLLTILSPDESSIVTHFRPDQRNYPRSLERSTYQ